MVMEQIMSFVRERVVQAAITRLMTSLNPAGAFIQAIIATYNTVMFFVERLQQIGRVVAAYIDSISAIASGNIGTAANRVETTMAGMLTLVISFLARIAGLGRVSDAVVNIVNRVRAPIDRALDRVVAWIVTTARNLFARLTGRARNAPDVRSEAEKQKAVNDALAEAQPLLNNDEATSDEINRRLVPIKAKYKLSLLRLNVAAEDEGEETDQIEAAASPSKKGAPVKKLRPHASKTYVRVTGRRYELKPAYQNKTFTRDMCYGKSFRSSIIQWRNNLLSTPRASGGLRHPTNMNQYWYNGQYYTNSGATRASLDHKHMVAQHWNSTGRKTTQADRKNWYNTQSNLKVVPLSINSSMGASSGVNYNYFVTASFRYP
jgi:hypothetical protein